MPNHKFLVDLRCHLANGETVTLLDYSVTVEAPSRAQARKGVLAIAAEQVHDEGGHLLEAPMDHLEILRIY